MIVLMPAGYICYTQAEMQIPHGLVVDDCRQALYVADRERSAVHRFRFTADRQPPAASAARPDKASADSGTRLRMRRRRRLQSGSAAQGVGGFQAATSLAASAHGWRQPQEQHRQHQQRRRGMLQEPGAGADAGDTGPEGGSTDPAAAAGAGASDTGEGDSSPRISSFSGAEADEHSGDATAPDMTADLSEYGPVYGLTAGPYGSLLALCWDRGADRVWLLLLDFSSGALFRAGNQTCCVVWRPHSRRSHGLCAWSTCWCAELGRPARWTAFNVQSNLRVLQVWLRWRASGRCRAWGRPTTWRSQRRPWRSRARGSAPSRCTSPRRARPAARSASSSCCPVVRAACVR